MKNTITVIGLGGVGAQLLPMLRELEPEIIYLIDHDKYEPSNQTRQPLSHEYPGLHKATSLKKQWETFMSPATMIAATEMIQSIDASIVFNEGSLVISAVDNRRARNYIREQCVNTGCIMVTGANAQYSGEAHLIYPEFIGTERDPWVQFPELGDEENEPKFEGCSVDPNPQTYATNAITAAAMIHLIRLHKVMNFCIEIDSAIPTTTKYTLGDIQTQHKYATTKTSNDNADNGEQ